MNDKHKGPHCDGLCEGQAYLIKIRGLEAENDRMRQTLKEIKIAASMDEARQIAYQSMRDSL